MRRYEETKPPRFVVERADGGEMIRIPARKDWIVLPFISLWLLLWTAGGIAAIVKIMTGFDLFLLFWLAMWAAGWLFAASTILWQIAGAEYLIAAGGDLELGYAMPGFRKQRVYRGGEIRGLTATDSAGDFLGRLEGGYPPFFGSMKSGSIRFSYGARTVRAASGLDEAEGRMLVDLLRTRLPPSAAEQ